MVVGIIGFDCDHLGRWSSWDIQVSSEIWPDKGGLISVRNREIWGEERFWERENRREAKGKDGMKQGLKQTQKIFRVKKFLLE